MNDNLYEEILRRIGENHGVTPEEVDRDMREALQVLNQRAPRTRNDNVIPLERKITPEDFIEHVVYRIAEEGKMIKRL